MTWPLHPLVTATCIVPVVCITLLGPGLLITRRLAWRPLERLCAAVGFSALLLYLAQFTVFVLNAPTGWSYAIILFAMGATWITRFDLGAIWRCRASRQAMIVWCTVTLWTLLLQATIRHFGGGGWGAKQ